MIARLKRPNDLTSVAEYVSVEERVCTTATLGPMVALHSTCSDKMSCQSTVKQVLICLVRCKDEAVIFRMFLAAPMIRRVIKGESHWIVQESMFLVLGFIRGRRDAAFEGGCTIIRSIRVIAVVYNT